MISATMPANVTRSGPAPIPAFVVIGILLGVAAAVTALGGLVPLIARRALGAPEQPFSAALGRTLRLPLRILAPLVAMELVAAGLPMRPGLSSGLLHGLGVGLILASGFLVVRTTYLLDDLVLRRYRVDTADNLRSRQVQTQIQVLRRVTVAVVALVSVALALLSFSQVRAAGAGLLASAGVIGIVSGVAARPMATNLLAGLQIAISQPIRVDDVVVVDGHWGRIEQIALTYVVVRIWDLRRLVLPVSYFISTPFENWTRETSEILGWVHLSVDYSAPIDAIRARFEEVLAASANWDGKVSVLQVTEAGPTALQLRALMSAPDSSRSWDLQCEVREQLIAFLQESHPGALPRYRAELVGSDGPGADGRTPRRTTEGEGRSWARA